jgi:hypothetical protein
VDTNGGDRWNFQFSSFRFPGNHMRVSSILPPPSNASPRQTSGSSRGLLGKHGFSVVRKHHGWCVSAYYCTVGTFYFDAATGQRDLCKGQITHYDLHLRFLTRRYVVHSTQPAASVRLDPQLQESVASSLHRSMRVIHSGDGYHPAMRLHLRYNPSLHRHRERSLSRKLHSLQESRRGSCT